MKLLEQYRNDLDKIIPKVAADEGCEMVVVAEAIQHSTDRVRTKDLTNQIVRTLREKASSEKNNPLFAPGTK